MAVRKGTKGADVFVGQSGAEAFDGVSHYDIVTYSASIAGVRVDLSNPSTNTGDAAGDTYNNIDAFKLSQHADIFIGSTQNDVVNGDLGGDTLQGRNGNDSLSGHSGSDTLIGGEGADSAWGGGDADTVLGEAGNDKLWGDAANDLLAGGTDTGGFTTAVITEKFYQYSSTIRIALSQIDDFGEWVVVPKYHNITNSGTATALPRVDGDAMFVVTNGYNDARDWNANRGGAVFIDLGPGGKIPANSSIVFNAGDSSGNSAVRFSGAAGAPGPKAAQGTNTDPTNIVTVVTGVNLTRVTIGDTLAGGSGADTFRFANGDGVDQITDFQVGIDRIDVSNSWFDGNAANGEFSARSYSGGTLILFTDTSADGYVDNMAIHLANVQSNTVNASLFI